MKKSLITALNDINTRFYDLIAQDFSDSRKFSWQGWNQLLPYLHTLSDEKETLSILDIGCGNGRFASFLAEELPDVMLNYTGVDTNKKLLAIAKSKLSEINATVMLRQQDIVSDLMGKTFLKDGGKFDLIVAFGVVHHIPSFELRSAFFSSLKKCLNQNGVAVLTLWNFMEIARMQKKQTDFADTDVNIEELETNDYLLSWDRGTRAYRYCHYTDSDEQEKLINSSQLQLVTSYQADGKEGTGNTYVVLK